MAHFIVLYGGRVDNGKLSVDSADRGEAALKAARRYPDSFIIFGVDNIIPKLSETTVIWLKEKGWPEARLILNPKGHNSLGEAEAAIEVLHRHHANEVIIAMSWYHIPRVWMIWQLKFSGKVTFSVAWKMETPIGSLIREFVGIPKTLFRILLGSPMRAKVA